MRTVFSIALVCILFSSCHVGRFFVYNFADVKDYKAFPKRYLKASPQPFYFHKATTSNFKFPEIRRKGKNYPFEKVLRKTASTGFLIIRNDSILYEWYRGGRYDEGTISSTFSLAKAYVGTLVGIAADEGLIKSTNEPITNYLDFLDKEKFGKITIQHLLDMQSGLAFHEGYFNPFSDIAKFYYGSNLKKLLARIDTEFPAGERFRYISLNTQLLGVILEQATGRTLTQYMQEKIWTPLGMEYDAGWSLDSKKNGTEKSFCCVDARIKDIAKFGRLYLNNGNWNGKQILSKQFVEETTKFERPKNDFKYSNQWWHTKIYVPAAEPPLLKGHYSVYTDKNGIVYHYQASGQYFAQGLLGQYIYVVPDKNLIFVRLGKREGGVIWSSLFMKLAETN